MQYHLDTIPVWRAMEAHTACPLCTLRAQAQADEVERALGASVMEPAVRIEVNRLGICCAHQQMLAARQNRLGHALLMDSHAQEQLQRLRPLGERAQRLMLTPKPFARPLAVALAAELEAMSSGCVVCNAVETHMTRYLHTFLHLWRKDEKFHEAWLQSQGVCLPHAAALLRTAQTLSPARQAAFAAEVLALLQAQLADAQADLAFFTRQFDHRNQGKPWGTSKTALQRVVNRLRGHCLEE